MADPHPNAGEPFGQIDLWSYDQYRASIHGYCVEGLVVFARMAGFDPLTLGRAERTADEFGPSAEQAVALQRVAHDQLDYEARRHG